MKKYKRISVRASRFPWQIGYGWRLKQSACIAPLSGGSRFGGGWDYNLGIEVGLGNGYTTILLNLLIGIVTVTIMSNASIKRRIESDAKWEKSKRLMEERYQQKETEKREREKQS